MEGLSKVRAWLEETGFSLIEPIGNSSSMYYGIGNIPITIRLGDHLGRQRTISDKYINVLPGIDSESYVLVIDKSITVVGYRELIKVLEGIIAIYSIIPDYLNSRVNIRKEFQQKEVDLLNRISKLEGSYKAFKLKTKEKLCSLNQTIKKLNNDIVVEINNL